MALTKRTYVDGETIITAANLNAIQDEVILHETNKVPTTRTVNGKALSSNISLSASDIGAVPTSRKVNNKALSADISLTASDVGAVPTSRTVNGNALSADVTLDADSIGYSSGTTYAVDTVGKAISDVSSGLANIDLANVQNVSTASEDIDTYTSGGIWYFSSSYTPTNKPSDSGSFGFLVVLCGGNTQRLSQIWVDSSSSKSNYYVRSTSASTVNWSAWGRLIKNTELALTDVSPTVVSSLPTGVTSATVLAYQTGNIVTVYLGVTRDGNEMSSYAPIASGLPAPAYRPSHEGVIMPFATLQPNKNASAWGLNVNITASGDLQVVRGTTAARYIGTFTYITNSIS